MWCVVSRGLGCIYAPQQTTKYKYVSSALVAAVLAYGQLLVKELCPPRAERMEFGEWRWLSAGWPKYRWIVAPRVPFLMSSAALWWFCSQTPPSIVSESHQQTLHVYFTNYKKQNSIMIIRNIHTLGGSKLMDVNTTTISKRIAHRAWKPLRQTVNMHALPYDICFEVCICISYTYITRAHKQPVDTFHVYPYCE